MTDEKKVEPKKSNKKPSLLEKAAAEVPIVKAASEHNKIEERSSSKVNVLEGGLLQTTFLANMLFPIHGIAGPLTKVSADDRVTHKEHDDIMVVENPRLKEIQEAFKLSDGEKLVARKHVT